MKLIYLSIIIYIKKTKTKKKHGFFDKKGKKTE